MRAGSRGVCQWEVGWLFWVSPSQYPSVAQRNVSSQKEKMWSDNCGQLFLCMQWCLGRAATSRRPSMVWYAKWLYDCSYLWNNTRRTGTVFGRCTQDAEAVYWRKKLSRWLLYSQGWGVEQLLCVIGHRVNYSAYYIVKAMLYTLLDCTANLDYWGKCIVSADELWELKFLTILYMNISIHAFKQDGWYFERPVSRCHFNSRCPNRHPCRLQQLRRTYQKMQAAQIRLWAT